MLKNLRTFGKSKCLQRKYCTRLLSEKNGCLQNPLNAFNNIINGHTLIYIVNNTNTTHVNLTNVKEHIDAENHQNKID